MRHGDAVFAELVVERWDVRRRRRRSIAADGGELSVELRRLAIRPARSLFAVRSLRCSLAIVALRIAARRSLHDTIRDAQRKVVKIYGAGGVRGLEAYQTGILISAEGHVLTV